MIPENVMTTDSLQEDLMTSRTYRLDEKSGRIIGFVDDEEAVIQAARKILWTERNAYVIYSSDYGFEKVDLIGQDFDYVIAELPRRIEEALTADDRILGIKDFTHQVQDDMLICSFIIVTIYSDFELEQEVSIR